MVGKGPYIIRIFWCNELISVILSLSIYFPKYGGLQPNLTCIADKRCFDLYFSLNPMCMGGTFKSLMRDGLFY